MKIKKLNPNAVLPTRKHPTDAGLDLFPLVNATIYPNDVTIVGTGISIHLPENTFGLITNKSRNNFLIGGGVVDQDYRGELFVKVFNPTMNTIYLFPQQSFAQLIAIPVLFPEVEEVTDLDLNTMRGISGGIVSQVENG